MSQEHTNTPQTGDLPDDSQQALTVLRNIWGAQKQTSADIDESCGNTKSCRNMEAVGFHGMVDEVEPTAKDSPSIGNNLRSAWKTMLEREGKLSTEGGTVRDLVFGSSDPNKE
ncbi:MAG TPA: hypothetical protein VFQ77_06880 [Pseudonocardiaceae bacterium]|jgi:hypothetical protein|nr:hypothetical protein [Pseudonocardiaceae bacterium]